MITLKNVVLRRSAKVLLDGATVTLNPAEKVGLVGRNGAGKSTLFALFNRTLHEDGGDFSIPKQWRMAQVAQNMPETDESATDFVVGGDTRLVELREALAAAERAHEADPDDHDAGMALAHAYTDLADAGEHDAVPRAQALILGLGFKSHELDEPVNSFSGGWRMRLQLARALMCPSDLLLLDEPTNHLDLDALVWLEAWLQRYQGTMIVISHDREFLDAVTDVTLHIEHAKLTRYGGNYSKFEEMRALQMEQQQVAFSKQQDKIAHLQKFIDRFKAKASKAKQAQSRVKALERMEKVAPLLAEADFTFEFKEPGNIPNPMLSITGASFGYEIEDAPPKTILTGVSRSVQGGQRIGILGANGQGKSTLVKTIAREMGALAGTLTEGKGLNIGYFAQQELDVLRPQDTPLEHMVRMARELGPNAKEATGEQALRGFLGSFNFSGDMVKQPVGTMSGGEKARLVLAMMVWQRPNLLLLDEPTNHLDLATREALAVALNEFEGTLMLVSHDRALLRSVCDEFWLVGRGGVTDFDGDLDDYQRYLLDEAKRLREEAKVAIRASAAAPPPAPKPVEEPARPAPAGKGQRQQDAQLRQQRSEQQKPLKREIAQIDARLATATADKAALEARLAEPLPPAEIAEAGKRLKALNDEISGLEERWLALSDQLEALAARYCVMPSAIELAQGDPKLIAAIHRSRGLLARKALIAAAASAIPVPGLDWATDAAMLSRVMPQISAEFGLSPTQLERIDPHHREGVQKAAAAVGALVVGKLVTRELLLALAKRAGIRMTAKQVTKYVPLAGQAVSALLGYAALRTLGEQHIKDCVQVSRLTQHLLPAPPSRG